MITGEIQTWDHRSKGRITGTITSDAGQWVAVKLFGDHTLDYLEPSARNRKHGSTVVLRKSMMTLVEVSS